MCDSTAVLQMLQDRGFMPQDNGPGPEWFEFLTRPAGPCVRVVLDDSSSEIHVLDSRSACEWTAHLSDGTPLSVVTTTVGLAIADAVAR